MSLGDFVRIERDERDGSRHFVVHLPEPKFSVELTPDAAAPDRMGQGVIKRVCVPNSWAGDYGKYAKLVGAAQEFFAAAGQGRTAAREWRRRGR
jgi:hypothetical protein